LRERLTPRSWRFVYPSPQGSGRNEGSRLRSRSLPGRQGCRLFVFRPAISSPRPAHSTRRSIELGGVYLAAAHRGQGGCIPTMRTTSSRTPVCQRSARYLPCREPSGPLRGAVANVLRPDFVTGATTHARAMLPPSSPSAEWSALAASRVRRYGSDPHARSFSEKSPLAGNCSPMAPSCDGALPRRGCRRNSEAAHPSRLEVSAPQWPGSLYRIHAGAYSRHPPSPHLIGVPKFEEITSAGMPNGGQAICVAQNGPSIFSAQILADVEEHRYRRAAEAFRTGHTFGFVHPTIFNPVASGRPQTTECSRCPPTPGSKPRQVRGGWELLVMERAPHRLTVGSGRDYKLPDAPCAHAGAGARPEQASVAPWGRGLERPRLNFAILAALLSAATLIFVFKRRARYRPCPPLVRQWLFGSSFWAGSADLRRCSFRLSTVHPIMSWRRSSTSGSASIFPSR